MNVEGIVCCVLGVIGFIFISIVMYIIIKDGKPISYPFNHIEKEEE